MFETYIFAGTLSTVQPPYHLLPEDSSPEMLSLFLSYEYIFLSRC